MDGVPNPGRSTSPFLVGPIIAIVAIVLARLVFPDLLGDTSLADFVLVSLLLGGATAWRTGRSVARGWGAFAHLLTYVFLLTWAVRFCHFALFEDSMFVLKNFVVEFILLFAIATLGFRSVRRQQMTVQYGWIFEPAGPFAWRVRGPDGGA